MADKPTNAPTPQNSDAVRQHKRLAMGQSPKTGCGEGKKTPA